MTITKGCRRTVRMFVRAEHRLLLRIDNADLRPHRAEATSRLVDDERWDRFAREDRFETKS